MKVTTDACILGAWAPIPVSARRALDIGTGTGLLALMLAQRNPDLAIDAIEFDDDACAQAGDNFQSGAWQSRIRLIKGDARNYQPSEAYDLIIVNPPFFSNSLLGSSERKNIARHTLTLSGQELASVIFRLLSEHGQACVLFPVPEYREFSVAAAEAGLQEIQRLEIRHNAQSKAGRVVAVFTHGVQGQAEVQQLVIKDEAGTYTSRFRELLGPFYLYL